MHCIRRLLFFTGVYNLCIIIFGAILLRLRHNPTRPGQIPVPADLKMHWFTLMCAYTFELKIVFRADFMLLWNLLHNFIFLDIGESDNDVGPIGTRVSRIQIRPQSKPKRHGVGAGPLYICISSDYEREYPKINNWNAPSEGSPSVGSLRTATNSVPLHT